MLEEDLEIRLHMMKLRIRETLRYSPTIWSGESLECNICWHVLTVYTTSRGCWAGSRDRDYIVWKINDTHNMWFLWNGVRPFYNDPELRYKILNQNHSISMQITLVYVPRAISTISHLRLKLIVWIGIYKSLWWNVPWFLLLVTVCGKLRHHVILANL